jgi:y4mF family transcriptional regulator
MPVSPESPNPTIPPLGPVVRFHRREAGLTQARLARLAGVGKTVVLDIEGGKRTVRLETLRRVLEALNIRMEWRSPLRESFEEAEKRAPRPSPRPR